MTHCGSKFPTPSAVVAHITDTFRIVKGKDEEKWSDYRTQPLILGIYDRMQRAIETGEPFQTILSRPRADPPAALSPKKE